MKNSLFKWLAALGVGLALLIAGNAWADGHGKHGKHHGPPHHVYHHAPKYVHHHVHHYAPPVRVHHYYAPAPPVVVQHHTYYVPAPAPVYVAPPPPPPGFAFSATINEPGFSLGIAAGR